VVKKKQKAEVGHIDIRMHPDLKVALDNYCEAHLEKVTESIASAIKNYIGFGKAAVSTAGTPLGTDEGKTFRLSIRVHPRLKDALAEYCKRHTTNHTQVVTDAIKIYIGVLQKFE
jgi:hypothetical protein